MVSEDKNWFGMVPHTTDHLIHWSSSPQEAINMASHYRACYDRIEQAGCLLELTSLMRASYTEGSNDAYDDFGESGEQHQ